MRSVNCDQDTFIPPNGIIKAESMRVAASIEQSIKRSEQALAEKETSIAQRLVDAETRGFEEGYQDGLLEFSEAAERYNFALENLLVDIEPILMGALKHLIDSIENEDLFSAMVHKALDAVRYEKKIIICVHSEQERVLRHLLALDTGHGNDQLNADNRRNNIPFGGNISVEVNNSVDPMSCDIFTPREVFSVSKSIILEQFLAAFKQPGLLDPQDTPPKRQDL